MVVNSKFQFDTATPLQDAVNQFLQRFIGSFKATTARLVDNSGQTTESYSSVVHSDGGDSQAIPVDNVAAVIDCYEVLTIEALEAAYRRIKTVKSMRKTERSETSGGETQMTTGIIVARNTDLTLEQISWEMDRLNSLVPSHFWPDAVSVLSVGIVNYAGHIPGSERSGDFFLPAEAIVTRSPAPSIWVNKVIRPGGDFAFRKVASLIVARVAIFQPGVKVLDYRELMNLKGQTTVFFLDKPLSVTMHTGASRQPTAAAPDAQKCAGRSRPRCARRRSRRTVPFHRPVS